MEESDIDAAGGRLRRGRPAGRGLGPRRGGGRRRVLLAPPPVPLGTHQPTRRPLRGRPPAAHPQVLTAVRARPGTRPGALAPLVLRRTGPVGRGDPRARRRPGRRPGRAGGPGGGGPGRTLLGLGLPTRRPHPGRLQPGAVPPDAPGGGRPGRRWCCRAAWWIRRQAQAALDDGVADLVEMTRAQIAEPRLVGLVRAGQAGRVRPCILCNQACQVRDNRNPLVSCVGEPRSGSRDRGAPGRTARRPGPRRRPGGGSRGGRAGVRPGAVGPGSPGPGGRALGPDRRDPAGGRGGTGPRAAGPVWPTGWPTSAGPRGSRWRPASRSRPTIWTPPGPRAPRWCWPPAPGRRRWRCPVDDGCPVLDPLVLLSGGTGLLGHCPRGRWWSTTRWAVPSASGWPSGWPATGRQVALVTPDQIAGTLLSLTGDLADANTRLQRAGVRRELRALLRRVERGQAHLEDVWTGEAPHRRLRRWWWTAVTACPRRACTWPDREPAAAGDCVAPRGVLEAVLEGRRLALGHHPGRSRRPRCSRRWGSGR